MRKVLFSILILTCLVQAAFSQSATFGVPVSIGRNNCGSGGGTDSTYFFNYAGAALTRATYPNAYRPRLKIGPSSNTDRWSISAASISFNPKDQKLYYLWTDYSHAVRPTGTWTYIWRWKPDTTFTTGSTTTVNLRDTLRSFPYDIGGVAFDNDGIGWTLEFPAAPCARAFFRPIDFAGNVYNAADTLDFTSGPGGIGDTLWNPGSGDITMLPSGQIYYNFDNKLYTPDYGSYGGSTHHIKSTYIDTTRRPSGASSLVGLAFADGDLISSYATGCLYRRLDPVTGDTNFVSYSYASNKGVYSVDMTQINSGIGSAKKLVSVTTTGTPNQYVVVYDVFVKNYGTVPVTNVQVTDNLGSINGILNVSNVSAAFISNPAGLTLNPLYNGTIITTLLASSQTLPNYPSANNNFTIRITCTLSGIQSGTVYNNQAVATANGFNTTALRDSSTNGSSPDLNQNDKPDDVGESQPTPFVIILTPTTAPCTVIGNVLYSQDFGIGTGLKSTFPTGTYSATTNYVGSTTAPLALNRYSITNNAINGNATDWISLTDHTGNATGNMMVVNADASANIFYRDTMPVACSGQQYSVSLWAAFLGNTNYQTTCNGLGGFKYPKFLIRIRDQATGLTITQTTTSDITSTTWTQYGMKFVLPSGYTNLILEVVNAGPGGCGNDVAIDDIQFGTCSAAPTVSVAGSAGCLNSSTSFNSTLTDPTAIPGTIAYQWQVATALAGPYSNISGATSATYTIASLAAADTGKYYRLIIAASGNIGITGCQYISPGIKLSGVAPSVAPSSATAAAATICVGSSTTLTAVGATLGTGANYQWGTGSVVGTSLITGATSSTLSVSPTTTTTYWVRVENNASPCTATTGGTTVTVTVNQPSTAPGSITGADICNGSSTTLTAVGGALGTGANYQWGLGAVVGTGPISGATSDTYSPSPTTTTTYWVRIQNTAAPCTAITTGLTKVITVIQPSVAPSSVTVSTATICSGSSTNLTAIGATLGTGANYQWGTGSVVGTSPITGATSSTLSVSPTATTTYWVRVENTTSPCTALTGGATVTVNVNQPSVAPTSITGLDICNGSSTTLTALGGTLGTGANYQWGTGPVVGSVPITGATNATLTVSPTTTTTYWVRIQNTSTPCAATTTGLTRVITVSQPSVAPTSATAAAATICSGSSTTLTAVGATLGTSANYQWGTGSVVGTAPITGATSSTLSVSPTATTTYWVRVENTASPCTALTGGTTVTVTVNQPSTAPASVTGADICNGSATTLTAVGGTLGTGANYQWGLGSVVGTGPISGATSATYSPSPATTTTYWVRIQNTTAPCTATTTGLTKVITVTQPSVAPASISAPSTTICNGSSVTLTATGATLGTGANYQWGTGAVVGTSPITGATSSTLSVSPTSTTTYWVRVENTASPCTALTGGVSLTVTVNLPSVAPSSVTGADICSGASTTLTAIGATLGTGANYQWGTGSVVGTSPITGATGSTLTVSPTSTTTYWVRVENTSSPCTALTSGLTKVITVTQPSVAPASISAPSTTICNGSSVTLTAVGASLGTGANYQWGTGSVVGTSPITGATSSTLSVSPGSTTTYWVRVENTSSPCTALTGGVSVTITVNEPSTGPSSVTGADICNGSSTILTALGGGLGTGANYQWGTGSVVGTSPITGATSATLSVSPTTTTTYWVRVENNAAPCAVNSAGLTKVITVSQPSVAPASISAPSTTICNGSSVILTANGATLGTGANYQWGTGSVVGTSPISGATSSTLSVSPTSTTTYWVRVENTSSPCTALTGGVAVTVTVNQASTAPSSVTGVDICNGSSTTLTAVGGALGTGANYQWGTGSVVGTSPISGATSATLSVSPSATTTYWVRIENNAAPCTALTSGLTKVITVTQPSVAPASISAPSTTICNGSSVTLTAVGASLGTGANYQWGTGSVVGTSPISGATSSTLSVSPTATTTYWVRVENTASPCTALTGGVAVTVNVNNASTAPASVTGTDVCNGTSTTLTAVGGTLGSGANYQWGTGSVVGTSPITGATSATLTVTPSSTTTYWVRIENNAAPCTANSTGLTKVITVSQPSVAPASVSAPSTTICNGSSVTLTANGATLGTGANYQWGTGAVVGTSPITGATGATLSVSPTATTTYWVRVENTSSPCTALTGGVSLTVTVNQPSVAPASVTGADICNGSATTLTAVGGTLGTGANYQWGLGSVVGTGPISGATSATYSPSPTTTTTYWVRIQNTTAPCTALTSGLTKVITVSQPSVAPASISAPSTTICSGSSVTLTATGATLGTGANYQWGLGSVVGTSPITGATSSTMSVSPTATTTYWVRVENTSSPCTALTGGVSVTINVNQPSAAPSSVTGADICNGSSTTLTAVGGTLGTGANYQWGLGSVVGTGPITGATSATYTPSPTTTTTYWVRIQNTTAPCTATTTGLTKVITVTQPSVAPAGISSPSTTICNGSSVTLTATGATLGTGANYQWGTGSVVGTSPITGATSSTMSVSPTSTTTYWVRVENTSSPCTALTGGVTVTINVNQPSAAPSSVTGADICSGSSTTLTAIGGTLGTGANYQWGLGSVVGTGPISGATSATYSPSPATTTTYWVRIQNTTTPCTATTTGLTKVITVTQASVAPASISAPSTTICNGSSVILTAVGATLGTGANYQWGTGSVVGTSPITGATSSTLSVSPTVATTYWVRVENTSSPCTAITGGTTVTIAISSPSTAPGSVTGADICNGSSTTLTALGGSLGTGANYQWGTGAVVGTNPIAGATSATLTVSPASTTTYWVRIQNTTAPCAGNTAGLTKVITVSQPSVAATSASKNKNNICPGISVTLSAVGGTLGTGASWKWYTGSAGGTLVGTGASLVVTPSVTTTYYVRAEGSCNTTADQSVTVFISCDIDKDKDGIPDFVESNMAASFTDANSNGIINAYDVTYAGFVDNNNDYINDNFQADGDSDNDGIPNYLDATFPGRVDSNGDGVDDRFDADKDGIINMLDLDSDNDGIPDVVEAYGVDTNGDGKIDSFTDTDGDGLSQNVDINNTGASNTGTGLGNIDFDGDGVPNFVDLDSDNDGIPDVVESGGADSNNDGKLDGFVDVNNDGLHDSYINATGLLRTGADGNNDGKADSYPNKNLDQDFRPNAYDMDSDADGIIDLTEAGFTDNAAPFGVVDGTIGTDGWSTSISSLGALNLINTDGRGNPDYLDIDADDDGIPDNVEAQATLNYKLPTTVDGDGDGLATVYDNQVGFGGSGITPWNHDGDLLPDYRDLDTDGDGQPDIIEGNDFNLNGFMDDNVTLTGLDTDGDGLDNRFDSLNSTTNLKGTSYMMGTSGSTTGDATPGSRCTVQKKTFMQIDRDWRFVGAVLPVQFLNFNGVLQGAAVPLNWTIMASVDIDHFEVERSFDNNAYTKVGTVSGPVKLNVAQNFGFTDDISNVNKDILYYRLKVITKSGEEKYSNVLVIRLNQVKTPVTIMPNPAKEYVAVRFFVEKESDVTIRVIDNLGKTVVLQKQKAPKGNNVIQVNGLSRFSAGIYSVQVFVNDEVITKKIILEK